MVLHDNWLMLLERFPMLRSHSTDALESSHMHQRHSKSNYVINKGTHPVSIECRSRDNHFQGQIVNKADLLRRKGRIHHHHRRNKLYQIRDRNFSKVLDTSQLIKNDLRMEKPNYLVSKPKTITLEDRFRNVVRVLNGWKMIWVHISVIVTILKLKNHLKQAK